jgi:hypothetical protein
MHPAPSRELNVITAEQMRVLTSVGLAQPQHQGIAAFTYYDGSWWAYGPRQDGVGELMWFRTDEPVPYQTEKEGLQ